jgi:hypothetical protein
VIVLKPVQCVLDEESPHFVAACVVKVDRLPPGSSIAIREIRPVRIKVVAFRTQMVVNDIQRDRQAKVVGRIYEALERFWAAVTVLGSVKIRAVIAPIS